MIVTTLNSRQVKDAINEQSSLMDPTPLFLPTPMNASQQSKPIAQRELGETFNTFPPRLQYHESEVSLSSPWHGQIPTEPREILLLGDPPNPFRGIVKEAPSPAQMLARLGRVEVVSAGSGPVCLQLDVPLAAVREPFPQDWKPFELLVHTREGGVAGLPIVVSSSGVSQIDQYFCRYLAGILRIGHRIPAGMYNLRIGP
jgi:hypothetical protein